MKKEVRFIQFPLFLLRDLMEDRKTVIGNIISYGIWNYSKKINFKLKDVARQIMYDYYRGGLMYDLIKMMNNFVDNGNLAYDETFNGFTFGNNFEPTESIEDLLKLFDKHDDFKTMSIQYYQIHQAAEMSRVKLYSVSNVIKEARHIDKKKPLNDPMPMVNVGKLFEYRDQAKSEFDLMQFLAFISINSIIGKKPYYKTNKKHILSRMFGYASHLKLEEAKLSNASLELIKKYFNRYHFDKLLKALEQSWHVVSYSYHTHGLNLSINNKMNLEALALVVETNKVKNRERKLKQSKQEARQKALQHINSTLQH